MRPRFISCDTVHYGNSRGSPDVMSPRQSAALEVRRKKESILSASPDDDTDCTFQEATALRTIFIHSRTNTYKCTARKHIAL